MLMIYLIVLWVEGKLKSDFQQSLNLRIGGAFILLHQFLCLIKISLYLWLV